MKDDTQQKVTLESVAALRASLDAAIEQRNQALLERDTLNVAYAELRQRYAPEDIRRQMEALTRERDAAVQAAQRSQALLSASVSAINAALDELRHGCKKLSESTVSPWRYTW